MSMPRVTIPVKWKQLGPQGKVPLHSHEGDAGYDLFVSQEARIKPLSFYDVHTDIAFELPPNAWIRLVPRSSALRKRGLLVNEGTLDNGYRGELFVAVFNLTPQEIFLAVGERVAQVIPQLQIRCEFSQVEGFGPNSDNRGDNGFGSTGT